MVAKSSIGETAGAVYAVLGFYTELDELEPSGQALSS